MPYPPTLLAWTWLLLSTTYALPIATSQVDRSNSLNYSSRLNDFVDTSTSAPFDDDPATLFKRGKDGLIASTPIRQPHGPPDQPSRTQPEPVNPVHSRGYPPGLHRKEYKDYAPPPGVYPPRLTYEDGSGTPAPPGSTDHKVLPPELRME